MNRRKFSKQIVTGLATVPLLGCGINSHHNIVTNDNILPLKIIKPRRLREGDTVGLIAPASAFKDKAYQNTLKTLKTLGLKYIEAKNLHHKTGFLAGTDKERIDDIHEMFANPDVDAVWCIRGGYGTGRIIPMLDYDLIKKNPKIIVGYSDITSLLHAIFIKTGLVGFHGPTLGSTMNPYSLENIHNVLMKGAPKTKIEYFDPKSEDSLYAPYVIQSGKMTGQLSGGNLTLLASLAGTKFNWDATDKLAFIEDIGEKPYRIDRMLTQLRQSANLDKAKGILLGIFEDCPNKEGDDSWSLKEVLIDRLGDLGIPVFYGFSFGHILNKCTIPVGIEASFDTETRQLTLLESCVI